jgi:hypothetical protein
VDCASHVRLLVFCFFAVSQCAHALPGPQDLISPDPLLTARDYFDKSVDDDSFIELARELFATDIKQNGNRPVSDMYLAALGCIEAKHSIWPLRSLRLANQALEKMESIVRTNPKNIEVRLLFAATLRKLPLVFGRRQDAEKERQIVQELFKSPDSPSLPPAVLRRFKEILGEPE